MDKVQNGVLQEELYKEMDMVQACIHRMQHNSFIVKGWMLTILGVIFSFTFGTDDLVSLSLVLLIPVFCFWYLDAFFLRLERMYRKKYEWIIVVRPGGDRSYLYDLNPYNQMMWLSGSGMQKLKMVRVMFSAVLLPFYVTPVLILLLLAVYKLLGGG